MKCDSKKCQNDFCDSPLNHLNRIEGQIKKIKELIENGEKQEKIVILMKSVSASFESVKQKILKNFILEEINKNKKLSKKELENIEKIFNLFK
jgi:DNA-binding FrmR family transcriptional regulator